MATNKQAYERMKAEKVEYEWGTLWPHYHKERMNWASPMSYPRGVVTPSMSW